MKNTIELQVDEHHRVLVEVWDSPDSPNNVASSSPNYYAKARELSESLDVIRPLVEKITAPLLSLDTRPKTLELEFGFRFGGEAQVVLTQNQSESLVKVRLIFEP